MKTKRTRVFYLIIFKIELLTANLNRLFGSNGPTLETEHR